MNALRPEVRGESKRRCFVISPIGADGSEQRQHADDVYDFIIKPAMDECEVVPVHSDHVASPGRITEQMFRALLQADFCIAVVTYDNPNVFYELAIAHAASRPVVMLNRKGHSLPFDVQDMRCVDYDYLPRPLAKGDYVRQVVQQIRELESTGCRAPDLLGTYGLPVGERLSGVTRFLARSSDYESCGGWEELLQQARTVLDIGGMTLSHWRNVKGFSERLIKLGRDGCRVRVLLMNPEHPLLTHCFNPAIPEMIPAQVISEMNVMWKFFSEIAAASQNIELRLMRRVMLSFELARTDEEAVSRLYDTLAQEFNALWDAWPFRECVLSLALPRLTALPAMAQIRGPV